ncbi:MAG: molybdopterin-dependent oxidoreductase [Candidatus Acetothermia bacterium]|nr:molybdopterin-dependent oxidoreductase [Candidatus Acetothermia bacterium]MDH7505257.1 molybdopterin-dependent oxidoreductase [Candidatus Acetothermia bacterium]
MSENHPAQAELREYRGERLGSIGDFRENSTKGVQEIDLARYKLAITGLVQRPRSFKYHELKELPRKERLAAVDCVEGWSVKALWEGIPLKAIFALVQPKPGANTVIFHAQDGYTTSLPLAYLLEKDIIIADRINGLPLPAALGFPFILVAEGKWGYKWARWITEIELSDNPAYRGFWEERGYNNQGDVTGPMFEG